MSTDSPKTYNSIDDLNKDQKDINPDPRYWTWFEQWWAQDFSWGKRKDNDKSTGLARHTYGLQPHVQTLQDYWKEESGNLIDFAGKKWTRFHLPPHDKEGKPSKKPLGYVDWNQPEWRSWYETILDKIKAATPYEKFSVDTRAQLQGICFPDHFDLSYDEEKATSIENQIPRMRHLCADWALFVGLSNFDNTNFGKNVSFNYAMFSKWASFDSAQFTDKALFLHTYFLGDADFKGTKTNDKSPTLSFQHAVFLGDADFTDRGFGRETSFSNALFYSVTKFHGCTFHENICFADAKFSIPTYIRTKGKSDPKEFYRNSNTGQAHKLPPFEEYESAFRTLRLHMEKLRNHGQEMRFARLEMLARERRLGSDRDDVPRWVRVWSRFYGFVADYGQNAVWPLIWLGAAWLFASFGYSAIAQIDQPIRQSFGDAAAVAFQYSLPPVSTFAAQFFDNGMDQNFKSALLAHPFLTRLVMVLHGVISLALVFFLLLALKRRFQIR